MNECARALRLSCAPISALACGIFCWWARPQRSSRWLPRRHSRNMAAGTRAAAEVDTQAAVLAAEVIRAAEDLAEGLAGVMQAEVLVAGTRALGAIAAAAQRTQAAGA